MQIEMLRTPRLMPTVLSVEQVRQVMECAEAPYDTALFIAAHAGLRQTELRHLTVGDVDLAGNAIHVSAKRGWSPKSHEERSVPMNRHLRAELQRYLETLDDRRPGAWLFPGQDGEPIQAMNAPVRKAYERAGLYAKDQRPGLHQLRRTFASELLLRGVDINTVRELGGWANLAVVQRYLASTSSAKRSAVELLEG